MALTINHETNDISATSGSVTLDGSSVGGGDMTLISTTTISSAVASVDISLSSSYAVQMMVIHNLDVSAGTRLRYRVSDDSGTTFESTSSYWTAGEQRYVYAGGAGSGSLNNGSNALQDTGLITRLINSFDDLSARVMIYNSQESSVGTTLQTDAAGGTSSTVNYADCASRYIVASVITDIRIFSESGNLTKGVIKLYGLS